MCYSVLFDMYLGTPRIKRYPFIFAYRIIPALGNRLSDNMETMGPDFGNLDSHLEYYVPRIEKLGLC